MSSKTRYIVAYRTKELNGSPRMHPRRYSSFTKLSKARQSYNRLKGQVLYRCLSYGFGNVLAEQGRERDA